MTTILRDNIRFFSLLITFFLFMRIKSWETICEAAGSIALIVEIPAAIAAAMIKAATNQLEYAVIIFGRTLSAAPICSGVSRWCPARPMNRVENA